MKESLEYQENLEEIFRDFSNITIIIKDNYNFSYLNRLTTNLLGFNESEILEMSFIELLTPDSLENCIDNIRLLRETGFCQPFIVNLLKKNSEIVSLELSGIKLDNGRFFFMGKNLSLERLRKEKLEYLEEFNKNILNSIGEGIVVLNPQGNIIK
ncbi:MAG: PAS domain S-box protein [Candidatus Cloacimonadota bacterium]|nr:MAG: PAS domain S-box protein [Candidatus Cloacimonadota bacterium]